MIPIIFFVNYIVPAVVLVCSSFLGYLSIRKWLLEPYNHEHIFYWGISFVIMSLAALNTLCCGAFGFGIKNSMAMHVWVAIALWFQLFAIASVKNISQHSLKKLRLGMWIIFLTAATTVSIIVTSASCYHNTCYGLLGLQIIDSPLLDMIFEVFYGIATLSVVIYLMPIRNIRFAYFSLYGAFVLLLMSRLTSIINIAVCDFSNTYLIFGEWALVIFAMFFMVSSVYNLVMCNEGH